MSSTETAWVWKHSPYSGSQFALHLAMADVVNDAHQREFWMDQAKLATKARCSRETANRWIRTAQEDGFLTLVEDNRKAGRPSRFRFLLPTCDAVWAPYEGVTKSHTSPSEGVTNGHTGCDETAHGGVTNCHTEQEDELEEELNTSEDAPASPSSAKKLDDEGSRPEVDRLCELLASLILENGSKRPSVTKQWRAACRLLLDVDGRTERQVETIIRWSQADEFWKGNILSMRTLRTQFDKLRIRRNTELEQKQAGNAPAEVDAGQDWMRRSRKQAS